MDSVHGHLILNHLPILGVLFGLLLYAAGFIFKSTDIRKAALVTFIVTGLITIPSYFSGEEAEHTVEHLPGISEHFIEIHEDLAKPALIFSLALAALSLVQFILMRKGHRFANIMAFVIIVLAVFTFIWMLRVGNTGGEIRHSEIRTAEKQ